MKTLSINKLDKKEIPLIVGLFFLFLCILPALILGGDGMVTIHDQLDAGTTYYALYAKQLKGIGAPEFMDAQIPSTFPSFVTLLFYLAFPTAVAFTLNSAFIQITAFVGLYLLLREWDVNPWIAVISGHLFCALPFYADYGLSIMGQPLLCYACVRVIKGEQKWYPYLITVLFALASDLVLSGYADCVIIILACILLSVMQRNVQAKRLSSILFLLMGIYVVRNYSLILQVLAGRSFVSHRTEWTVGVLHSWSQWVAAFLQIWRDGQYHAVSNHTAMVPWVIAVVCTGIVMYSLLEKRQKQQTLILCVLVLSAAAIAAFYATWRFSVIAIFRREFGGVFKSFQADRFYMLYPFIWYSAFGLVLNLLYTSPCGLKLGSSKPPISRIVSISLVVILTISMAMSTYNASRLKVNLERLQNGVQPLSTSINNFYSTELFQEIADYIGRPKDEFRVGSVALYPSVPLYNGFNCIDGYLSNYDVEYKHRFREIIADELNKNDEIQSYFDTWGSRCYLFASEIGKSYYYLKNSTRTIKDLQLDHDALVDFGCDYIFSGLEIENFNDSGLRHLHTFECDNSPYKIWLYQVEG